MWLSSSDESTDILAVGSTNREDAARAHGGIAIAAEILLSEFVLSLKPTTSAF
jgi:hypothetical protein